MAIHQKTPVICDNCRSENDSNLKYCYSCGYELPKVATTNVINDKSITEQDFVYTSEKYTLGLLGICFGLLILLIVIFTNLLDEIEIGLVLSFSIPVIIFFIFKKNIKRFGKGEIKNGTLLLKLDNEMMTIDLNEIENYKIEHYNGTIFKLKLKSGKKHKITANDNFCDTSSFEEFTEYFESIISNYKSENNLEIVRKKSMLEYKWMFYVLIIMTIAAVGALFYVLYFADKTPGTLFSSLGIVFIMWAAYYKAQKKKKKNNDLPTMGVKHRADSGFHKFFALIQVCFWRTVKGLEVPYASYVCQEVVQRHKTVLHALIEMMEPTHQCRLAGEGINRTK